MPKHIVLFHGQCPCRKGKCPNASAQRAGFVCLFVLIFLLAFFQLGQFASEAGWSSIPPVVIIGFCLNYLLDGNISDDHSPSKCALGAGVDR